MEGMRNREPCERESDLPGNGIRIAGVGIGLEMEARVTAHLQSMSTWDSLHSMLNPFVFAVAFFSPPLLSFCGYRKRFSK